jgi:hypothetical protein
MLYKRKDLVVFFKTGVTLVKRKAPAKFHYALEKNLTKIQKLQGEMDREFIDPEYNDYRNTVGMYLMSQAEKDEKGNPKQSQNSEFGYIISEENKPVVMEELKKMEEANKPLLDRMAIKYEEHNKKLEEDVEFEFHLVPVEFFPEVQGDELHSLTPMILDTE